VLLCGGALISGGDRCSGRLGLVSIMTLYHQGTGRQWHAGGGGEGEVRASQLLRAWEGAKA